MADQVLSLMTKLCKASYKDKTRYIFAVFFASSLGDFSFEYLIM